MDASLSVISLARSIMSVSLALRLCSYFLNDRIYLPFSPYRANFSLHSFI